MKIPDKYMTGKWLWIYRDSDGSDYEEEYAMTYTEALEHSADICCELWTVIDN